MKKSVLTLAAALAALAFAQSSVASTIVVDLDPVIVSTGNSAFIDVNEDGVFDIGMRADTQYNPGASLFSAEGGTGYSQSALRLLEFDLDPFDPDAVFPDPGYYSIGSVLIDAAGELVSLAEGTHVDGALAGTLGARWGEVGKAYDRSDSSIGPIPNVGDSAYIGVRIETFEYIAEDGCNGCEIAPDWEPGVYDTFYAWLQIERGSLIASAFGYNPTAGGAAVVPTSAPAVPLPAGLPLLLAGLGAFGIMKRRKG